MPIILFLLLFVKMIYADQISPPLGLPAIPWPNDNPYEKEKAELGRLLYFDPRLSADGTISCATCHHPHFAYTDAKKVSTGIYGQQGTRNAPTVINSAYLSRLFWDGRAASLEEQCAGPVTNPKEMARLHDPHAALYACHKRIEQIKGYRKLFKQVFGEEKCTMDHIKKAIATFERTVLSGNSPYDRYMAGDRAAMSAEQIHGYQVFKKAGCADCHFGPNFSDGRFLNIGVGMDQPNPDLGRYLITKKEDDWGAFKVPILRDIDKTAPYMHDGSLATLEEVVDYYDRGGTKNKNLHPLMRPLKLTEQEKKDLVQFLKALSGEGWQHIAVPKEFPN